MQAAINFVKDAYAELNRVQWPDRQTTTRLTGVVIGVSLAVGLYIRALDYLFELGIKNLLN